MYDLGTFLAFTHELVHNELNKPSCAEPFKLIVYARKNSKRLLCGLFCISMKADIEVKEAKMVIAFYKGQGNDGVKVIRVETRREEEKEVIVRREIVSSRWETWNHDNLSHA